MKDKPFIIHCKNENELILALMFADKSKIRGKMVNKNLEPIEVEIDGKKSYAYFVVK